MKKEKLVLIIDAGSSALKMFLIDKEGNTLASVLKRWTIVSDELFPNVIEYGEKNLGDLLIGLINELFMEVGESREKLVGISCISQRMNAVFMDKDDNILYFGPNIDSRGALVDFQLSSEDLEKIYNKTGHYPPFLFTPYRYMWFVENEKELVEKIDKIMSIHDAIIYLLTGEFLTEPTISSATMLMNIKSCKWDKEILSIFGIEGSLLPEIKRTGELAGYLREDVKDKLHIFRDVPVFLGGGDTQFGTLATQAFDVGDVGCVIGYTAPVQGIYDKPVVDPKRRLWTEKYIMESKWVVESNTGTFGGLIDWFIKSFLKELEEPYKWLSNVIEKAAPEQSLAKFYFGENIMDSSRMMDYKIFSTIILPNPSIPFGKKETLETLAYGFVESLVFALIGNIEQVREIIGRKESSVGLTGGVTRIGGFNTLLASALGEKCRVTSKHNGSALACAAIIYTNAGIFSSIEEALKTLVPCKEIKPDDDKVSALRNKYMDWRDYYERVNKHL
ncbi:MAG: FGGY family carbohydrate kinase [Candidatus Njordarchaeales archaeon]